MNANELRLGNLVYHKYQTGPLQQDEWVANKIAPQDIAWAVEFPQNYKGIPLTPEILEACGFTEDQEQRLKPVATDYNLSLPVNGDNKNEIFANYCEAGEPKCYACYTTNNHWSSNNLYYLHQLQNLYFALTSSELPVNLQVTYK
jgi:hypothetical protein